MDAKQQRRWFGLLSGVGAVAVTAACQEHALAPPIPVTSSTETDEVPINPSNKLDVVFMIDNSPSMQEEQANLIRNFPAFMKTLQDAVPAGSLDVHIGVISSDLGAGSSDICPPKGDNGAFQHRALGMNRKCKAVPRGSFIVAGPEGNNFDGPIEEVFSCIAELGYSGCGFEHQLASLRRALGGDPTTPMPAENVGFLRPDARLGVVLITDEDDCSAPPDTDLFTGVTDLLTSRYGADESYRCNEFGHLCAGSPPPRQAGVVLHDCVSNETPSSRLLPVADMVASLRKLKPNPADLVVATITGPNTPYETQLSGTDPGDVPLSGGGEHYIEIKPSCHSMNGDAAPAVRLQQFTEAFEDQGAKGSKGILRSICVDDFSDVMTEIARAIGGDATLCVGGRLLDTDPTMPGLQADCIVEETPNNSQAGAETVIASCARTGNAPPCWSLQANPTRCPAPAAPQSMEVKVDWGSGAPAVNARLAYHCSVCARSSDPGCAP